MLPELTIHQTVHEVILTELEQVLEELNQERDKVGLLMQPIPKVHGDFPWQMMRLWVQDLDRAKQAHRTEVRLLKEKVAELEAKVSELGGTL